MNYSSHFDHFNATHLNTTSPRKSDGGCHCNEMADFGDGDVCVAVFSNPPQLINLAWLSGDGANLPTYNIAFRKYYAMLRFFFIILEN